MPLARIPRNIPDQVSELGMVWVLESRHAATCASLLEALVSCGIRIGDPTTMPAEGRPTPIGTGPGLTA
jgi:hypothetical protein